MKTAMLIGEIIVSLWGVGFVYWVRFADEAEPSEQEEPETRSRDAKKVMTEHEIAQKAFSNNRERLKAERLAREAAGPPPENQSLQGEGKMTPFPFRGASARARLFAVGLCW